MLNKYDFTNNDDVIDQPSILKITSNLVLIIHAGSTDTEPIPEEGLVILIGNIDSFIPPTPDPIDPDDPDPTPDPDPDPDPQPGDTVTQTILFHNYTNSVINIDYINVLIWDENNSTTHLITGNIIGDYTVEANDDKTLTIQFEGSEGESITDYIGWKFAQPGQYPEVFSSNCGYHTIGSSFHFKADNISQTFTFGEGSLFSFAPENQTRWITNVDPQPEPGDSVSQGTVNLIIKNDSNITFDENHQISTTQDGQTVTATTKLNAYFKLYVQGALNKISAIMSARNNSSQTDLNLDSDNNPACRFLPSGYTLNPNEQIQISNVHWKVNSDDTRDNIPETGRDIINGTGEGSNTFYMSNGYYSTKDFGIKVVVSGESGKFKNNGTYTLSIQNV